MSKLQNEIAQQRPFASLAEEALLNLMRTADCINRTAQRMTRGWGITSTQYNVLRILRGAHPEGLTCSAIGERMITADPDITRLLARLKTLRLIRQQRDKRDRRVVWTNISSAGLALLAEMDLTVQRMPGEIVGHLSEEQLGQFVHLLELARARCHDGSVPVSCDGNENGEGSACASETRDSERS